MLIREMREDDESTSIPDIDKFSPENIIRCLIQEKTINIQKIRFISIKATKY